MDYRQLFRQMDSISRLSHSENESEASQYRQCNLFLILTHIVRHPAMHQSQLAELVQMTRLPEQVSFESWKGLDCQLSKRIKIQGALSTDSCTKYMISWLATRTDIFRLVCIQLSFTSRPFPVGSYPQVKLPTRKIITQNSCIYNYVILKLKLLKAAACKEVTKWVLLVSASLNRYNSFRMVDWNPRFDPSGLHRNQARGRPWGYCPCILSERAWALPWHLHPSGWSARPEPEHYFLRFMRESQERTLACSPPERPESWLSMCLEVKPHLARAARTSAWFKRRKAFQTVSAVSDGAAFHFLLEIAQL